MSNDQCPNASGEKMIPGSNLLNIALGAVGSQPVTYEKYLGTATNAAGFSVQSYEPAVAVLRCSLQPVPRARYEILGLEMTQQWYTWFVPTKVLGLGRDCAGDYIDWQGKRMRLSTTTDWAGADGWTAVLCVVVAGDA